MLALKIPPPCIFWNKSIVQPIQQVKKPAVLHVYSIYIIWERDSSGQQAAISRHQGLSHCLLIRFREKHQNAESGKELFTSINIGEEEVLYMPNESELALLARYVYSNKELDKGIIISLSVINRIGITKTWCWYISASVCVPAFRTIVDWDSPTRHCEELWIRFEATMI